MRELPTDLIDLREHLDAPTLRYITELYSTLFIELQPDAWRWRLRDVCELYFRLQHDAPEDMLLRAGVARAINEYLEDEYA